jgi:mannose-1-phosphate guanylyltransferase/phosphomannomutase
LKQLSDIVPTLKAEFGVMFDAGAEKIFVVDEKGHLLTGSEMLAFFLRYTFTRRKGAVAVVPIDGSHTLEEIAKRHGGKVQRSRTSFFYLMEAAAQKGVSFAGEAEGGYMFPAFAPFMDAMMSTAKIMECVAVEGQPVSHYLEGLPRTHQVSVEVPCAWETKGTAMRNLLEETAGEKRDLIDGIKVHKGGASVMMLPDSDKACFKVTAEASSEKDARALVEEYAAKIRALQG